MNQKLILACSGKSASQGGLNFDDFRREMAKVFPELSSKIHGMKRKTLINYCNRNPEIKQLIREEKERYFLKGVPLSGKQKDYCRCIAHVSGKNQEWCYKHNAWKRSYSGRKGCVNPYAVCTKSTSRRGRFHCLKFMDLEAMPQHEVQSLAKLNNVSVEELKRKIKVERSNPNVYY